MRVDVSLLAAVAELIGEKWLGTHFRFILLVAHSNIDT